MEALTGTTFLVASSVWIGGVVFFSFFTAPVIFERLPRAQAAELIAVIFPRYYNLGYVCGLLMLASGLHPIVTTPSSVSAWTLWLLALIATGVSLYAGKVVMPRVKRLRLTAASTAGTPEHGRTLDEYRKAHQLSVALNSLVLLTLFSEIVILGYRISLPSAIA